MHTIFFQISDRIESIQITEFPNPIQPMAFIEFENGYSNIFFLDLETGKWVEQDLGFTHLAEALGTQLRHILHDYSSLKKNFRWCRKSLNHKVFHFGFYTYVSGKDLAYEIFAANRRYMFTLIKKARGRWQICILPGTEAWTYDKRYLEIIPYLLEIGTI
jgi:hypothetical protein